MSLTGRTLLMSARPRRSPGASRTRAPRCAQWAGHPGYSRLEYRVPGADALAVAAALSWIVAEGNRRI
jgi:hypothetical protein